VQPEHAQAAASVPAILLGRSEQLRQYVQVPVVNHQASVAMPLPSAAQERCRSRLIRCDNDRLRLQRPDGRIEDQRRDDNGLPGAARASHGTGEGTHIMAGCGVHNTALLRVHA